MSNLFHLNQQFNDFDFFCDAVKNWDLEYIQLGPGDFHSELLLLENNRFQFTHASLNRNMLQHGASPKGMITFGILARPNINIHWRNIDIADNKLFIFPENGELKSVTHEDFDVFVVSVNEKIINRYCNATGTPDIRKIINKNEAFECDSQKISAMRLWLNALRNQFCGLQGSTITDRQLNNIESLFIVKLLTLLTDHVTPVYPSALRRRDKAVKTVIDFIRLHYNRNISLSELCQQAKVSERTLEYAFLERFGVGPKQFLKIYRLNAVKKRLNNETTKSINITEAATLNGFWHMSQFAMDYQQHFRELPSATLKAK